MRKVNPKFHVHFLTFH